METIQTKEDFFQLKGVRLHAKGWLRCLNLELMITEPINVSPTKVVLVYVKQARQLKGLAI